MTISTTSEPLERCIAGNKTFSQRCRDISPDLLKRLGAGQSPKVLWLGCADSRIPETTVCDCQPGDIFVHRNIANIVRPGDTSSQAVIDYAVGAVGVDEIIVCGHTKCGGANAALGDADLGENLNDWLGTLRELRRKHTDELDALGSQDEKADRLAELNVKQSIETVKANKVVQKAMSERGLTVHGLIYDIPHATLKVLD